MTTADTFGRRLRHARELVPAAAPGGVLSTRELGALACVSSSLVSAYETEERDNPTRDKLVALSKVLGVDLSWLCTGHGIEPTEGSVTQAVERARFTRQ